MNPLYTDERGRGRFYIEAAAMWDDWCARKAAAREEDRGNILPRSYKDLKAAQLGTEAKRGRARGAQRTAERAAERERAPELAEIQRRLPAIPACAAGQHPGYRRTKDQPKWSTMVSKGEPKPPPPRRVKLTLTMPKKPGSKKRGSKGKGKGKAKKTR